MKSKIYSLIFAILLMLSSTSPAPAVNRIGQLRVTSALVRGDILEVTGIYWKGTEGLHKYRLEQVQQYSYGETNTARVFRLVDIDRQVHNRGHEKPSDFQVVEGIVGTYSISEHIKIETRPNFQLKNTIMIFGEDGSRVKVLLR